MMVFSPILPSAFKGNGENFRLDMLKAMTKSADAAVKEFKKTTATWTHKPSFEKRITGAKVYSIFVGPFDEGEVDEDGQNPYVIYQWVTKGTKKHNIPKEKTNWGYVSYLSFKKPKTYPGFIGSGPGSPGHFPVIQKRQVTHPGIKPRRFDEVIQTKWQPIFEKTIEDAIAIWAKKTGHAL